MHVNRTLLATGLLWLVACTGTAGSDSREVTVAQCRAYYEHIYRLDGADLQAMMGEELLAKESAACAETGTVTKRHYDCAMAARSVDDLQACGAPNT